MAGSDLHPSSGTRIISDTELLAALNDNMTTGAFRNILTVFALCRLGE